MKEELNRFDFIKKTRVSDPKNMNLCNPNNPDGVYTSGNLKGLLGLRTEMEQKLNLIEGVFVHSGAIEYPGFVMEFKYGLLNWSVNVELIYDNYKQGGK
jgi:hypothetical protein